MIELPLGSLWLLAGLATGVWACIEEERAANSGGEDFKIFLVLVSLIIWPLLLPALVWEAARGEDQDRP